MTVASGTSRLRRLGGGGTPPGPSPCEQLSRSPWRSAFRLSCRATRRGSRQWIERPARATQRDEPGRALDRRPAAGSARLRRGGNAADCVRPSALCPLARKSSARRWREGGKARFPADRNIPSSPFAGLPNACFCERDNRCQPGGGSTAVALTGHRYEARRGSSLCQPTATRSPHRPPWPRPTR